jgi:hypothetical protein
MATKKLVILVAGGDEGSRSQLAAEISGALNLMRRTDDNIPSLRSTADDWDQMRFRSLTSHSG